MRSVSAFDDTRRSEPDLRGDRGRDDHKRGTPRARAGADLAAEHGHPHDRQQRVVSNIIDRQADHGDGQDQHSQRAPARPVVTHFGHQSLSAPLVPAEAGTQIKPLGWVSFSTGFPLPRE